MYTLPVRPTPSCLANTYASSGEGERALVAAVSASPEVSSALFRNASSDVPVAVAVDAREEIVREASSEALEEGVVAEEDGDDPLA